VAILILTTCAATTTKQLQYWRNGETLFVHAIKVVPDNSVAHAEYAEYLVENNRFDEAKSECDQALRIPGRYDVPHLFLGIALYYQGAYDQARQQLQHEIRERLDAQKAEDYLGRIALARKAPIEAEEDFRKGLELNPDAPSAHCGLGKALALEGKPEAARREFEEALHLRPEYPEARGESQKLKPSL
jgi:tetratricopeptide (TPR) repeat protein